MTPFLLWFAEDEFIPSSVDKKKNGSSDQLSSSDHRSKLKALTNKKEEEKQVAAAAKLKPVKADDFFATAAPAVKLPKIPKLEKKGMTEVFVVFCNLFNES